VEAGDPVLPHSPDHRGKLDLDRPNAARMYDYLLGGSANVAVDRAAADELVAAVPEVVVAARANRAFLGRVVRELAERGIDQFLDLGSGIPTAGNVHEIARQVNPAARVAYVDIESVAVSYARKLLAAEPCVSVTRADIREPETVLGATGVSGLLDFTRPVAILAVGILQALPDADDPAAALARYRAACAPGSYLAISHLSATSTRSAQLTADVYARTPTPLQHRDRTEIARFFAGYRLLPPGVVLVPQWRPDHPVSDRDTARANAYAGLGVLDPPA
jgi:hypothetical protein